MRSGHTRRPREAGIVAGKLRIIGGWALEARNAEKNHHRLCQVTVGRDLLDAWTVEILYGCAGQGRRVLRFASMESDEISGVIRDRLRCSLIPPKRIGCRYRLSAFDAAPGFDASAWLPGDLMASRPSTAVGQALRIVCELVSRQS
jgi:hypothetical protein